MIHSCLVCVCVCVFGCTPFPKLSRSVPTSVAIATVPLWNRPGPLQCHSGAALGENEKHRSAIYWVMVQMEKIQKAGIRCRFRSSGQRQHGKDRCVHCFCIWLGVHVPVFPKLHFIGSGQPIHSGCAFHPVWHIPQGLGCDPIVSEKPFCRGDLIGDGRSKAQCTSKMACCVKPQVCGECHHLIFNHLAGQGVIFENWNKAYLVCLEHAFTFVDLLLFILRISINMDAKASGCLAKGCAHSIHLAPDVKQVGQITATEICKKLWKFQTNWRALATLIAYPDVVVFKDPLFPAHVKSVRIHLFQPCCNKLGRVLLCNALWTCRRIYHTPTVQDLLKPNFNTKIFAGIRTGANEIMQHLALFSPCFQTPLHGGQSGPQQSACRGVGKAYVTRVFHGHVCKLQQQKVWCWTARHHICVHSFLGVTVPGFLPLPFPLRDVGSCKAF